MGRKRWLARCLLAEAALPCSVQPPEGRERLLFLSFFRMLFQIREARCWSVFQPKGVGWLRDVLRATGVV